MAQEKIFFEEITILRVLGIGGFSVISVLHYFVGNFWLPWWTWGFVKWAFHNFMKDIMNFVYQFLPWYRNKVFFFFRKFHDRNRFWIFPMQDTVFLLRRVFGGFYVMLCFAFVFLEISEFPIMIEPFGEMGIWEFHERRSEFSHGQENAFLEESTIFLELGIGGFSVILCFAFFSGNFWSLVMN